MMFFEKDTAVGNMQKDVDFFASHDRPAFRFYGFSGDCITAGYSQDIGSEIDLAKAKRLGVDVAKRPTGGGMVFHSSHDIAFCCVFPAKLFPKGFMSAYHFVSDALLAALKQTGAGAEKHEGERPCEPSGGRLCFSGAKDYEIAFGGKKLAGIAQKKTRDKILQQGTICVSRPGDTVFSVLRDSIDSDGYFKSAALLNDIVGEGGGQRLLSFLNGVFSERFETKRSFVL